MANIKLIISEIDKKIAKLESRKVFYVKSKPRGVANLLSVSQVEQKIENQQNLSESSESLSYGENSNVVKNDDQSQDVEPQDDSVGGRVRGRRDLPTSKRKKTFKSSISAIPQNINPDKNHFCIICNKTFSKSYSLTRHMKLHTGDRPHRCEICFARYIQRSDLRRHIESIHVKLPKFQCSLCVKTFCTKKSMKNHELLHNDALPYRCGETDCGKGFKSNRMLRIHKIKDHSGIIYRCDICGKSNSFKDYLKKHMKSHAIGGPQFEPRNNEEILLHYAEKLKKIKRSKINKKFKKS
jgi:uncharacterized Zn-finger protein